MKRATRAEITNQISRKYYIPNILIGYRIAKDDDIEKIRPVMLKHRQTMFKLCDDSSKDHVTVYIIANPSGLDFQFLVTKFIPPVVKENGDRIYWDEWFVRDSKGSHKIYHSFPQFSDFIQTRIEDIYYMALEIYGHKTEGYVTIGTRSRESMINAFLKYFYTSDSVDCSFKIFNSMVRFQKKDNDIWFTFPDGYSCRLEYANIISYYTEKLELRATHKYTLYSQLTMFMEAITEWLEANTSFKSSSELPEELNKKYARTIRAYHKREKDREERKKREQERLEERLRRKKYEEAWARQREENTKNRISPYNIDAIEKARQEKGNMIWTGKEWRKSLIDL